MQLFTSNGSSEPGKQGTLPCRPPGGRTRYAGRCLHRLNENGLLAIVERHRDEIRRRATLPRPADPGRQ